MSFTNVQSYNTKEVTTNAAPAVEAETGSGGGDMAVWGRSRVTQLNDLVHATYVNNSAYTLPVAIVDVRGYSTPFENVEETPAAPPARAEEGIGGGDMNVWFMDRVYQLKSLITTTFTDASTYSLPKGIVDNRGYEVSFENTEYTLPSDGPSGPLYGSGGGDMNIWSRSRLVKLNALVTTNYANQSTYSLPGAFVDLYGWSAFDAAGNELPLTDPEKGVYLGANFYNLLISGDISAAPVGRFDTANPVAITDATVKATQVREDGEKVFETTPQQDGTFDLSVDRHGTWVVVAERDFLYDAYLEVDVQSKEVKGQDVMLGIPGLGGSGTNAASDLSFG